MSAGPFRLDGRVALVTGAARGLGAAIAEAMIAAGAKVMLSDVLQAEGKATAQRLSPDGQRAAFRVQDVTDERAWQETVAATVKQFGALDLLVNNAGIETAALITQCTVEDFRQLMDVNVTGVFLGMKHTIPVIKPGGSIINLSSVAGMMGTTGHIAYHASKGAVRSMTKAAAIECAQLGTGIRVNSLHPGIVQTDMGTNFIRHFVDLQLAPDYATAEAGIKALHPMGFGEVGDIASAVIYLASDAARWVNGSELVIDGGLLAA